MMTAITCRGLSKTYGPGVVALSGVDLEVDSGQIFGLVGRNGAGKSTLMKILLGLVRATAGDATVLGEDAAPGRRRVHVGSLIETPAFYPYLSGRQNLRRLARYRTLPPRDVDAVLDTVGLAKRRDSRVSGYSLGMKQRLGVAAALLGEPRLLVLDEPVNGLDPQAIIQVRELLAALREQGRTVLLSSHLLAEVEQVCDRVAVLHEGRLVAEDTPDKLRTRVGLDTPVRLSVSDAAAAVAVLTGSSGVRGVCAPTPTSLEVKVEGIDVAQVVRLVVTAGIDVAGASHETTLETAYLSMTKEQSAAYDVSNTQGDR